MEVCNTFFGQPAWKSITLSWAVSMEYFLWTVSMEVYNTFFRQSAWKSTLPFGTVWCSVEFRCFILKVN